MDMLKWDYYGVFKIAHVGFAYAFEYIFCCILLTIGSE